MRCSGEVGMLGRRDSQESFFEAQFWPHRVAEDSIYGRMAAVRDVLFNDDDLAKMYVLDNGRRRLPPSLMCGVLLLQFHDNASDGEAVERTRSEEHTSELQSRLHLVCRLLLEKK